MKEGIWYQDRDGVWHFNVDSRSSGAERCGINLRLDDVARDASMIDPVDGTGTYCGPCMDSLTDEERERHLTTPTPAPTPAPTERPAFDSLRVGDRVRWIDPNGAPIAMAYESLEGVPIDFVVGGTDYHDGFMADCLRVSRREWEKEGSPWVLVSRAYDEVTPERPAFDSLRAGDWVRWSDPEGNPPEMPREGAQGVEVLGDALRNGSSVGVALSDGFALTAYMWDSGEWALVSRAVALEVVPAPEPAATRPSYYNRGGVEAIDVIHAWRLSFDLGSVIKYVCRAGFKGDDVEDLKKARQCLDFEIAQRESK